MKHLLTILLCAVSLSVYGQQNNWKENKALQRLKLENTKGKKIKLRDIDFYGAAVVVFLSPECPLSINYTKNLSELHQRFTEENILFLGVYAGKDLSSAEIEKFRKQYRLPFDILMDTDYALTTLLTAKKTPEVFLTDPWGGVQYRGAIDDWAISLGKVKSAPTQDFLLLAIEHWLMNEPIWPNETAVVGCPIEIPE